MSFDPQTLVGRTVTAAHFHDRWSDSLTLKFDDGTTLLIEAGEGGTGDEPTGGSLRFDLTKAD